MSKNSINLFDFVQFPNIDRRELLRSHYEVFTKLIQIKTNILEKYKEKEVPFDFIDYGTSVITWIIEYNHELFAISIPLYQMFDTYHRLILISSDHNIDQCQCLQILINYYSEIIAYYIDSAFEKSIYIFNSMFRLKINQGKGSLQKIVKEISRNSKNNRFIEMTNKELSGIKANNIYQGLKEMRNLNTHSIRATQQGFLDIYNEKTGITESKITTNKDSKETVEVIIGAVTLLCNYTEFINNLLEEYYDSIYDDHVRLGWITE